jgi:hypothetical protein
VHASHCYGTQDTIADPVRRQLAAKLSVLDELVKNVTGALAGRHMLNDTLIIYTAGDSHVIIQRSQTTTRYFEHFMWWFVPVEHKWQYLKRTFSLCQLASKPTLT